MTTLTPARLRPPSSSSHKKSHFLSGGVSGVLSAVLLQPADLLKTRLQQSPPASGTSATATLVHTIRTISHSPSPVRAFWRGTLPSAVRTGVGSALYFSCLNSVRSALSRPSSSRAATATATAASSTSSSLPVLSPVENLLTGALTRAAVGFAMMPVTIIKVRYESSMYAYPTMAAATRDIMRAEGLRGFFSGWGATAVRDAPYAGLYVVFYELGKTWLSAAWSRRWGGSSGGHGARDRGGGMDAKTAAAVNVVSGAGAGALATAITNPFDTLKTRIQLAPEKYRNLWHAAKVVVAEEGRWKGRALFDGLGLRIARKAVSSAVVWGIYEGLVR